MEWRAGLCPMIFLIGVDPNETEVILCQQYQDARNASDELYTAKMKDALLDWCGETDWDAVRYRLNLLK